MHKQRYARARRLWLVMALLLIPALARGAETLTFYQCVNTWDAGFQAFQAAHPGVRYAWSEDYYANTSEIAGKLLTREMDSDVLGISGNVIDARRIIEKGYFLDLSGSAVITQALDDMLPVFAEACRMDGKIYGVPYRVWFDYWAIDPAGWAAAGLSAEDVPGSFPALLDFLDAWCARAESGQEAPARVWSGWDATVYNSASYTRLLAEMLVDSVLMQQAFAGESLSFTDPALEALFARVQATGARIYASEPPLNAADGAFGLSLFQPISRPKWPEDGAGILFTRWREDQPRLMKTAMDVYAVNARAKSPTLCVELLEKLAQNPSPDIRAYLYQNAGPVEKASYAQDLAKARQRLDDTQAKLNAPGLDTQTREALEYDLLCYQSVLEKMQAEDARYLVSPAQLASYRAYEGALYLMPPGVLSPGTPAYRSVRDLEERFAAGLLTPRAFLDAMEHIAWMVQAEAGVSKKPF